MLLLWVIQENLEAMFVQSKAKITGEPIYPWRHHFDHYMPWAESDFDTWYKSLDLEIRKEYKIDTLNG